MKKKSFMILIISTVVISFSYIVMAISAEPGSEEDPLVTKSYVEKRNQQLKFYIEESIKNLQERLGQGDNEENTTNGYEVINVAKGNRLVLGKSAEVILRAGKATVIQSQSGGLADVTIGRDLKQDENFPANHLLIVPRDDGRGAIAVTDCIFMVKGSYHIE
ncbi:hypothetical protein FQB35_03135 [Crassaminicella thermophila]|uniref:Uncharacterized protein n=1 Tax=Crassaminicella thermophila TaxID=2599308 RepID=A0A5C0SA18_CRATE|nr:hypothetical protein [Crassaminicella thermophila]QEK11445.1 hypothetical protein FQB35_03135 [Crassaminicella thermophila]